MQNDLDALLERVEELRAQLDQCTPDEKERIFELLTRLCGLYGELLGESES